MKKKELYHLAELAGELVEYEDAGPVDGRVLLYSEKDEMRSVLREYLEAVVESIDVEPVDVFGTQYSGEHIAHELEPHREVFHFDYPSGRIEVNRKEAQCRLSVLKDLSEGYGIEEAIDTHYAKSLDREDVGIHIDPALDGDGCLKPDYREDLEKIMEIKRDKGQAPYGHSSADR
jgi:hypothetical protein